MPHPVGNTSPRNLRRRPNRKNEEVQKVEKLYPNLEEEMDDLDNNEYDNSMPEDDENEAELDGEEVHSTKEEEIGISSDGTRNKSHKIAKSQLEDDKNGKLQLRNKTVVRNQNLKGKENRGSEQLHRERGRHQNQEDDEQEPPIQFAFFLIFLAIVFFAVAAIVYYAKSNGFLDKLMESKSHDVIFEEKLAVLRTRFTNQNEQFWKVVGKLGVEHIIEVQNKSTSGPNRPLVLVFASIKEYADVLTCLARRVGIAFNVDDSEAEPTIVDGNEITQDADSKEVLDRRMEKALQSSENQKVVIITELNSLSYKTASIFFKFCDNEGAPYPKAVFIFTLTMDEGENFLKMSRKEITSATRSFLSDTVWKDGEKSMSDALIARILDPYPVAVMNEPKYVLNMCPSPATKE